MDEEKRHCSKNERQDYESVEERLIKQMHKISIKVIDWIAKLTRFDEIERSHHYEIAFYDNCISQNI